METRKNETFLVSQKPKVSAKPKIIVDRNGVKEPGLSNLAQEISDFCIDEYSLRYPDIKFHVVDLETLAGVSAAHGWPIYPETWQLTQDYYYNYRGHEWNNFRIYEIVCPGGGRMDDCGKTKEPLEAFIYDMDTLLDMKLVIAHVFGHAHVFMNNRVSKKAKENSNFVSPYSKMVELTEFVEKMYERQGVKPVMDILDAVNVLIGLVAYNPDVGESRCGECDGYLDQPSFLEKLEPKWPMWEEMRDPIEKKIKKAIEERKGNKKYPHRRINNIFNLLENSPSLNNWERELVMRARLMKEYSVNCVAPIKILHEGFASFIDLRFGVENMKHVSDGELRKYLQHRTDAFKHDKFQLNPYGFGFTLLHETMMRWAKGEYGFEYDLLKTASERRKWSKDENLKKGWEKVLAVAENYSDYDLIQNHFDVPYFTKHGQDFYVHQEFETPYHISDTITSKNFDKIKNALLFNACNGGRPFFYVKPGDADYLRKGELMIHHQIDPLPRLFNLPRNTFTLNQEKIEATLKAAYFLWKRPVHIKTVDENGNDLYISCNGKETIERDKMPV